MSSNTNNTNSAYQPINVPTAPYTVDNAIRDVSNIFTRVMSGVVAAAPDELLDQVSNYIETLKISKSNIKHNAPTPSAALTVVPSVSVSSPMMSSEYESGYSQAQFRAIMQQGLPIGIDAPPMPSTVPSSNYDYLVRRAPIIIGVPTPPKVSSSHHAPIPVSVPTPEPSCQPTRVCKSKRIQKPVYYTISDDSDNADDSDGTDYVKPRILTKGKRHVTNTINVTNVMDDSCDDDADVIDDTMNDIDTNDVDDIEYEVKAIEGHRFTSTSTPSASIEYKVKWDTNQTSWVSEENCNCDKLISAYCKTNNIKTAYLMCRVSTQTQTGEECVSLDAQESELRHKANLMPIQRIKVVKYYGSAFKKMPTELEQLKEYVNKYDIVMVYRVDRLSRNVCSAIVWADYMTTKDVLIYALSEDIYYTTHKNVFRQYLLNAENEGVMIGSRIKMAIKLRKEQGNYRHKLQYGKRYKTNVCLGSDGNQKTSAEVEDNPGETAVINCIRQYINNFSARDIAQRLNNKNCLKRGRKWNTSMVKYVLRTKT